MTNQIFCVMYLSYNIMRPQARNMTPEQDLLLKFHKFYRIFMIINKIPLQQMFLLDNYHGVEKIVFLETARRFSRFEDFQNPWLSPIQNRSMLISSSCRFF